MINGDYIAYSFGKSRACKDAIVRNVTNDEWWVAPQILGSQLLAISCASTVKIFDDKHIYIPFDDAVNFLSEEDGKHLIRLQKDIKESAGQIG